MSKIDWTAPDQRRVYQQEYRGEVASRTCGCGRPAVKYKCAGWVCEICAAPSQQRVDRRLGASRLSERAADMWDRHFGPWKLTPGVGFGPWQKLCGQLAEMKG